MFKTFFSFFAGVLVLTSGQALAQSFTFSPEVTGGASAVDTLPGGAALNTPSQPLSYDTTNFDPDYDPLTDTSNLSLGTPVDGGGDTGGGGGGGGGAPTATESAQATQQKITEAVNAYVAPTSTRNFSLGNLNSDNEASLIISSGNEENNVIFRVIRLIAMLIGTVAIILYIIAGYFMIFSQGDENQLTKGKQIVTFTSLGLVLAFGAYMIVQLVMGLVYFTT